MKSNYNRNTVHIAHDLLHCRTSRDSSLDRLLTTKLRCRTATFVPPFDSFFTKCLCDRDATVWVIDMCNLTFIRFLGRKGTGIRHFGSI